MTNHGTDHPIVWTTCVICVHGNYQIPEKGKQTVFNVDYLLNRVFLVSLCYARYSFPA